MKTVTQHKIVTHTNNIPQSKTGKFQKSLTHFPSFLHMTTHYYLQEGPEFFQHQTPNIYCTISNFQLFWLQLHPVTILYNPDCAKKNAWTKDYHKTSESRACMQLSRPPNHRWKKDTKFHKLANNLIMKRKGKRDSVQN